MKNQSERQDAKQRGQLKTKNQRRDDEVQLASYWSYKFKQAMVHKADYTKRWQTYMDAYNGDFFVDESRPEYKSNLVSNYIFSVIETIRPIMLDNDPKFQAMPRNPAGMEFSHDLQDAFMYEWDRDRMSTKLFRDLVTSLVTGTAVSFIPWNSERGEIESISTSPFNIFPDPLATSVEDAEHIIYASYKNSEMLRRMFPDRSDELVGGDVDYGELVHENNENANLENQILVLEVWTRDYESTREDGVEEDKKQSKLVYPTGRVLTIAPELGIVLEDKKNPYQDGSFPFVLLKDYDVPGKFWGEGEVSQLLSPQKYMNELNNSILDNAKATANMPWIIDRNSGIGYGKITDRPGLIIRKNPGSEVRRDQAPSMPSYVANAVETYKSDMEQISGVFNSLRGQGETGVYTAQGILALQEAGQSRIRLKVKIMEEYLGEVATLWYSRMRQFWKDDRWMRISQPDGEYDFKRFTSNILKHDYDIRIMAGSTMPVNKGAMLDLMLRLAQTVMPDGQSIVDREAVVEYLPIEIKSSLLSRIEDKQGPIEQQIQELEGALEEVGQAVQELGQGMQEVAQESNQNDEEQFSTMEQLMEGLESLQAEIVQLKEEHDMILEEQERLEMEEQIRRDSYNEGFGDAESLGLQGSMGEMDDMGMGGMDAMGMDAMGMGGMGDPSEAEFDMSGMDPLEAGMFGEDMDSPFGPEEEIPSALDQLGEGQMLELPDELLRGLESLTDDELRLLLQQYPQLADLLQG